MGIIRSHAAQLQEQEDHLFNEVYLSCGLTYSVRLSLNNSMKIVETRLLIDNTRKWYFQHLGTNEMG